jgi:hypothetical protein
MDAQKSLADAIKMIGRSMPVGMEVLFSREPGDHGSSMVIVQPDGNSTEYRFLQSEPIADFALSKLRLESQIEMALRNLLASIGLHTDCMTGAIDIVAIADEIEVAEALLGQGWEVDESHPANRVTSQPATASYPAGSLGEAIDDQAQPS